MPDQVESETLAWLFAKEDTVGVIALTVSALRLYAFAYVFLWLNMVISSFLTAMDRAGDSLTIMLFRALIFPAICLLILPQFLDIYGIFLTPAVSGALTAVISRFMWRKNQKRLHALGRIG